MYVYIYIEREREREITYYVLPSFSKVELFLYHFELLLPQNAEAVAQLSKLFLSKVPAWMIATLSKQKLQDRCFL